MIIPFPNKEKIHACGEYLKDRDCKDSRTVIREQKPIKIRFVPQNYTANGEYMSDTGQLYGEDSKPFGWTKEMTNRMKLRRNPSKPELETLVEFPPSPSSNFCNKASPDMLCESVSWIIKAGNGRFLIKLFMGDPDSSIRVDLKINDRFVAQNKIIEKNTLEVIEDIIEADNKFIVITSDCQMNCQSAMSKLNSVEISPYADVNRKVQKASKELMLKCGNAFKGGRCDKGENVIHCIFDDPSKKTAQFCNGETTLIAIPSTYRCKDQVGKFKCVYKKYHSQNDCRKYCPQECKENECLY